jgi:hypothetical protein
MSNFKPPAVIKTIEAYGEYLKTDRAKSYRHVLKISETRETKEILERLGGSEN